MVISAMLYVNNVALGQCTKACPEFFIMNYKIKLKKKTQKLNMHIKTFIVPFLDPGVLKREVKNKSNIINVFVLLFFIFIIIIIVGFILT